MSLTNGKLWLLLLLYLEATIFLVVFIVIIAIVILYHLQQFHFLNLGTDKPVRSFSETPVQSHDQCNAENISLEFHATTDFKENENYIRAHHSTAFVLFSPSVLRNVFGHLKVGSSVDILNMAENQHNHSHNFYVKRVLVSTLMNLWIGI